MARSQRKQWKGSSAPLVCNHSSRGEAPRRPALARGPSLRRVAPPLRGSARRGLGRRAERAFCFSDVGMSPLSDALELRER
eukprot:scaffold250216_cov31-Tisochrysis_lutea.AAC.1